MKIKITHLIGLIIISTFFLNSGCSPKMNIDKTISKMTLEEKASLVVGTGMYFAGMEGNNEITLAEKLVSGAAGASSQDSGLKDTIGELWNNSFDSHSVGISAAIPFGNQAAKARLQRTRLEKMQDLSSLEKYKQIIRQDIYDAVSNLEGSWRRILAAEQGVTAAYRDYKVEQSQFQLGLSTSTNVLYSATGLADAQLRRIYAFADYEIAQINLARATGTLLGQEQIQIASITTSYSD